MFSGFYTLASGMFMQQRSLNTIANNMANGETTGFRSERVISTTFEQEMLIRQERGQNNPIGKGAPVRVVEDVQTQFDPTRLVATERPFDLAINGEGYFNIASAQEGNQYLTRNGNFNVDTEGYLVLEGHGRVLGVKGEIQIGLSSDFRVDQNGEVYNSKGRYVDKLLITQPRPDTKLMKLPNGMYQIDEAPPMTPTQLQAMSTGGTVVPNPEAGMLPVANPDIQQGVLEGSNVNFNREMALMIETQRNFQSCSKALQMLDTINQKTTNIAAL